MSFLRSVLDFVSLGYIVCEGGVGNFPFFKGCVCGSLIGDCGSGDWRGEGSGNGAEECDVSRRCLLDLVAFAFFLILIFVPFLTLFVCFTV